MCEWTPCSPLDPLHLGKTESKSMFYPLHHPLQGATQPLQVRIKSIPRPCQSSRDGAEGQKTAEFRTQELHQSFGGDFGTGTICQKKLLFGEEGAHATGDLWVFDARAVANPVV